MRKEEEGKMEYDMKGMMLIYLAIYVNGTKSDKEEERQWLN